MIVPDQSPIGRASLAGMNGFKTKIVRRKKMNPTTTIYARIAQILYSKISLRI